MKRALFKDGKTAAPPSEHLTPEFLAAWAAHDTSAFHSRKAHYAEVFAWGQAAERERCAKIALQPEHRHRITAEQIAAAIRATPPKDKP
jgi:hypothetical protein